jgi:ATP-dependent protease ClpP protease subunit
MEWLKIRNEASGTTADIFITDVIDNWFGIGKTAFIDAIRNSGADNLNIHISSPGGNVDDALVMYDYLKGFAGNTTAKLSGIVASAATFLALGAKRVEMSDNAFFMIHNVKAGMYGTSDELRKEADEIDLVESKIKNIYKAKANSNGKNLKDSQIQAMLDAETWMTAQDALDNGFIDAITTGGVKMAAFADLQKMTNMGINIPQNIKDLFANNSQNEMKEQIQELKDFIASLFNQNKPQTQEVKILDNADVQAMIADLENKIKTAESNDAVIADLNAKLAEKEAAITAANTENETLKAEVARLSATGIVQPPRNDTEPGQKKAINPVWKAEAEAMLNEMSVFEREKIKA